MRNGCAALALAMILAGCIGVQTPTAHPASDPDAHPGSPGAHRRGANGPAHAFHEDWPERALPNGQGHDHYSSDHHQGLSTPNFQVLGWNPLRTDQRGSNAGGYFCGDAKQANGRTLAVVHSFTSDVAFVLVDVTDPAQPTKIGELVLENTHVWDVAMTPDQRHVLLATSPMGMAHSSRAPAGAAAHFRDACTGTTQHIDGPETSIPFASGVVLVDIAQPRSPSVLDFRPLPFGGGHSIVAQEVAGSVLVLVTVENTAFTNYYAFLGLLQTPLGARLETHSIHAMDLDAQVRERHPLLSNHDGYLQVHPVTRRPLAYLADGHLGVSILDIQDPKQPRVLSTWDNAAAIANPDRDHYAHSILPIDGTWEGRHYTFVSEECTARPRETPSCLVYVLDTTDPTKPQLAGAWTLPADPGSWSYPGFSPHYMSLRERTLFLSHWHAGLWALNVSQEDAQLRLDPIGVFLPDQKVDYRSDGGLYDGYNMVPVVADVLLSGQHVIIFDGVSGVYVLDFDEQNPAPPVPAWPLRIRP